MGMLVNIYKWNLGDCSNGGVSGRQWRLTLTNVEGPFEPSEDAPAAQILKRSTGNVVIRPDSIPDEKWNMFGGAFAYSSDTRFCEKLRELSGYPHSFPVAIHDRIES
jgi:hypothetical protein